MAFITLNASFRLFSRSSAPPNLDPTASFSLTISMSSLRSTIGFAHSTILSFLTHPWSRARFQAPSPHPPLGFLPGLCSEKLLQTRIQSWARTTWEHPQACLYSSVPLFLLRQTSQTLLPLPLSAGPVRWLSLIKRGILSKLTLRLRAFEAVLTIVSLCLTASLVKDDTSPSPCWGEE